MSNATPNRRIERFLSILVAAGALVVAATFVVGSSSQKQIAPQLAIKPMSPPIAVTSTQAHVMQATRATIALPKSASAAPQHLNVVSGMGVQVTAPGKAQYRYGILTPEHLAHHTFQLRNTQTVPLVIEQVISSCPCIHGSLNPATTNMPKTLAPGESTAVNVTLEPVDRGKVTKYIWVFIQGQAAPAASLAMTGIIQGAPAPVKAKPRA